MDVSCAKAGIRCTTMHQRLTSYPSWDRRVGNSTLRFSPALIWVISLSTRRPSCSHPQIGSQWAAIQGKDAWYISLCFIWYFEFIVWYFLTSTYLLFPPLFSCPASPKVNAPIMDTFWNSANVEVLWWNVKLHVHILQIQVRNNRVDLVIVRSLKVKIMGDI
jgi:hypothetical protein